MPVKNQRELEMYFSKFRQIEEYSSTKTKVSQDQYLCIRFDGYAASKRYLKHALSNNKYSKSLLSSFEEFDSYFKSKFNKQFIKEFVCSYIVNDEISIVVKCHSEFSLFKLCTIFAGVLSSVFTKNFGNGIQVFDARPILLDSKEDIFHYLRNRYLVSKRYALCKVLRMNSLIPSDENGVYDPSIWKNIDNATRLINQNNLVNQVEVAMSAYTLIHSSNKQNKIVKVNDFSMSLKSLKELIN
ncbi:hypothetical protein MJH12_05490 [bacterium]|nr:hypothetical protein [bacterium]